MDLEFTCPHCEGKIIVNENELNCRIFRHGIFKDSQKQINPHGSKEYCQSLKNCDKIFGCSGPFTIVGSKGNYSIKICDYI